MRTARGRVAALLWLALGWWAPWAAAAAASATGVMYTLPEGVRSPTPPPPITARGWILVDFASGGIVAASNAGDPMEPASLTKLMTAYLVFDAIARGEVGLQTAVRVSERAWRAEGSRMFLRERETVAVEQLLRGLIIQSGNDAAIALAEHLDGTEAAFAVRMNAMAAQLGMHGTHFTNSSGLPHPDHYSTAFDMTQLTRAVIRDFPEYYPWYSEKEFTYAGITQRNRNQLLWRDASVDGIKTGHTDRAGYCLVATARRDGLRFIATVVGAADERARADQALALLEYGYAAYQGAQLYPAGAAVTTAPLWLGRAREVSLRVADDLNILYPRGGGARLFGTLKAPPGLEAPLYAEQVVGALEVRYDGKIIRTVDLHVATDHPRGPWWSQLWGGLRRLFR